MKRTYLDSSVLIQAVQGVDGDKTAALLEDPEREFVAATFLKLELLPQPTFHKRKAELEFLEACSNQNGPFGKRQSRLKGGFSFGGMASFGQSAACLARSSSLA